MCRARCARPKWRRNSTARPRRADRESTKQEDTFSRNDRENPGKVPASVLRRVKQRTDLMESVIPGSTTGNFSAGHDRDAFSLTDGAGQGGPRVSVVNTRYGPGSIRRRENEAACCPKPGRKSGAITITTPGTIYCVTKTQTEAATGLDGRFFGLWLASPECGMP
jgi:hypothetical protein